MKIIGGFFELEAPAAAPAAHHEGGSRLTSGRAALGAILDQLRPTRLHVPFWVYDKALAPALERHVPCVAYALDRRLEPSGAPAARDGELLLYVDYFGLKNRTALGLAAERPVVLDDTQAYFARRPPGVWAFNSVRKYFGVPDGAFLFGPSLPVGPAASHGRAVRPSRAAARGAARARVRRIPGERGGHHDGRPGDVRHVGTAAGGRMSPAGGGGAAAELPAAPGCAGRTGRARAAPGAGRGPLLLPSPSVTHHRQDAVASPGHLRPDFLEELRRPPGARVRLERQLCERLLPLPVDHRYDERDMDRVARAVLALLGDQA